jgi:hypothetical protein
MAAVFLKAFHYIARLFSETNQNLLMVLYSGRVVGNDFESLINIFVSFLAVAPHCFYAT